MPAPPDTAMSIFAGRYEIERVLGEGATAVVYLARDTQGGRAVAVKLLRPELAESSANARFLKEIRRTAMLDHPHILPVLDSGVHEGRPYFVLPYMEGGTLRHRLKRENQLEIRDAIGIVQTVAEALDYAHDRGLIHRDVKPENILFNDGRACLGDFGIARALENVYGENSTSASVVRGTPAYMSPEQASGSSGLDGRSDIYALACVFYEMVTGMPAFMGPTPESVIAQRFTHPPRELRVYRPSAPAAIEAVLGKALSIPAADRFRTAGEFAEALAAAAVGSAAAVAVPVVPGRQRRAKLLLGLGVALMAALIGVSAMDTPLNQNDWILIADFDGPPGDERLAKHVRDLATQALKQSRFVQVFDRRQLNEVMRRASIPETTHVSVERARELAARSSVRAVISGSVRRMPPRSIEVVLHAVNVEDGGSLASEVRMTTDSTLADSLNVIVRSLRGKIGEREGAISSTRPLRDVATPSFAAFRMYSEGLDSLALRNDHGASNRAMWEAVRLDTAFAAAWAVMGANYLSARQIDSARMAYGRALAFPQRMSPAETYRLRGDAAYAFEHDLQATLKWYDLFLTENPNSRSGRTNRAVFRSALGQWDEAVRDLRDAVPLNPFGAALIQPTLFNLAAALVAVGRRDEARAVRDSLSGAPAAYVDLILAQSESRWSDAERIARTALSDPRTTSFYRIHAVTSLASALAAQGSRQAGDSVLLAAIAGSSGPTARWYDRARLLGALANDAGAGASGTAITRTDTSAAADMLRALWSAALGDTSEARRVLLRHGRPSAATATVFGSSPLLVQGWLAARRADWPEVTRLLGRMAWEGEMDPTIFDRPDSFHLRLLVTRAYDAMSRADSARAFRERMLDPVLLPPGHFPLRGFVVP